MWGVVKHVKTGKNEHDSERENYQKATPVKSADSHDPPDPPHPTLNYDHLITEEYLPGTRQTVYRCKEHPTDYYVDLAGIEESHFKPFHEEGPG